MEYERELKQTFNTATYYVRALCKDRTLFVEVEQENTGYQWRNQFVNSYIEEMTSKTGNFKTFDKFCRMIYSALQSNNNNGSVFIDLLTYHDLQILKARKAAKAGIQSQSLNATQRTKNKKYLILTYVVEFDRVHYPLALKFDDNLIDIKPNNRCARATDTTRQLLSHSIQSISSSNSSNLQSIQSSLTSSPNLNRNKVNKHKHYHSTPNLNDDENIKINNISSDKLNEILEENMKLKMILKQENNNIIQEFEEEINILKKELQNKTFEIKRITKNTKQFQQKNISSRLDELEDEIERLSTQLLSERTKCRRINREFHSEKIELNKKIEMLQASNQHYKTKCKSLKNELNSTKKILDNLRVRTSKQRLYSSSKQRLKSSETLRRSRSRNNNKYYPKRNNRNNRKKKINPKTHKYNNNNKYYRSSSAHQFQNKSRSRSPSIRFDPTEWAKNRKDKIARAKVLKNTFGKSRSPSPFRTSRSVSPINDIKYQKKRNKNKNKNKKRERDRSNSRKMNSFGTTISISPKSRKPKNKKNNNKRRLPLHPNSNYSSSTVNDENDLNLINSIKKRQKRILSISDDDDDDDECESTFNPTKEIESIDSRLNALQKFLRAAKSSS